MNIAVLTLDLSVEQKHQLRAILEQGLPFVAQPYLHIAEQIDASERQVIEQIQDWQIQGLIRRYGLVVKHRQLGYVANAMVVWDVTEAEMEHVAKSLSQRNEVSLCYRRPRQLPHWPYNLFCMIHGKSTTEVEAQIQTITDELALTHINKAVLFSYKAYKQQGARYRSQSACLKATIAPTKTEITAGAHCHDQ